ncbi:hypothetical protein, partial [Streptomyces otsuchiensis]|uniref:hypothetical protein n=1 Tax=Streptomyces otsuchiensis TaxID=2681388 RepID=UPI0013007ACD
PQHAPAPRYVSVNGEVAAGSFEWSHRPQSALYWQVIPLGTLGAAVFGTIGGAMAYSDEMSTLAVVIGAVVGVVIGALFLGGIALYLSAARAQLKKSVLELSTSQKRVKIPMGAIGYLGRAEFTKANKWRMSRMNFVVEPGPGLEIVSRDGKYITLSTTHADAVIQELLNQGMHPDALRVRFPDGVTTKPPATREPR